MTTLILLGGALFIIFVLVWFSAGEWYRMPADDLGPAEREWLTKEAADLLAEVASRALVLARMERAVEAELRDAEAGVRVAVRRRLDRADLRRFWGEFVRRSGLVEEDPARAIRELPALEYVLEESLGAYDEVLEMLRGEQQGVDGRKG